MGKINVLEIPIDICEEKLVKKINSKKSKSISKRTNKYIKKAAHLVQQEATGRALYSIQPLTTNGDNVSIDNKMQIKSSRISKIFKVCNKVLIFVSTIGEKIDSKIDHHIQKNASYGYILDQAASLAAETAAEYVQKHLAEELEGKADTTLRYSPGYCDWSINEQKNLFKILKSGKIGVTLNDSSYMTPRKSITGIIGICSNSIEEFKKSACLYCNRTECPYRRD
jgi:cobalamin-dependent methionine synthase I